MLFAIIREGMAETTIEASMAHRHDDQREGEAPAHNHNCGGLFGCGDEKGTGVVREDIKAGAFDKRTADRLLHMDDGQRLQAAHDARGDRAAAQDRAGEPARKSADVA